ncbi:MAG TPA: glutamate synthase large subunit [Acidobacteriota bacterium]|nr:glutamate synthase large subunit [Acidobacteriota bacterium]
MNGLPKAQGLYRPEWEHDSCGIGFVVDIKGRKSHEVLRDALQILENLHHRGACGCETDTGDGAGVLLQMPHSFLEDACTSLSISLPAPGRYAAGTVFLPTDPETRYHIEWLFERIVEEEGQQILGWRTVPTNGTKLGLTAKAGQPVIRQVFVARSEHLSDAMDFERKLYVIRRRIEKAVAGLKSPEAKTFYVCSLSHRTIVYKGMLRSDQLVPFYPDLQTPSMETALAMVHFRFSTNTFPTWARAHPYRYVCHNGEINTLRGNINWMRARQNMFRSRLFGDDIHKILPILDETGSDSAIFDNALELLYLSGRSPAHAMMMLIPEPWEGHESMSEPRRNFYRFHACLMEPWDGPASIAFTDGLRIGAVLDRNGLRPSRYYVTGSGRVILSSEVGVLDIPPEDVVEKGRLQPGRMLLVDTEEGRIISDEEIKDRVATEHPYGDWVRKHQVALDELPDADFTWSMDLPTLRRQQIAFGYTYEELEMVLEPMARSGDEPIGSMGNDATLAVLSKRPHLLYDYFHQLFAQVTNPPIDAIREELIVSHAVTIGPERNLLEPEPESARQILLDNPILSNEALEKLRQLDGSAIPNTGLAGFKSRTLSALYDVDGGGQSLESALDKLFQQADQAIEEGCEILILSDRGFDRIRAPIPALLATSGLHHHLIRRQTRTRVALLVESGEPREVHHFALLIGYGASAVNPYLVFETLDDMIREGRLSGLNHKTAVRNYIKATVKGLVKVMSKMGISTVHSYHGSQIFEAVGLGHEVIDRYFTGTPSRIGGLDLTTIAEETRRRYLNAFRVGQDQLLALGEGGEYRWRRGGEFHLFNPKTIHLLQKACRTGDYDVFKRYSSAVYDPADHTPTIRSLFRLKAAGPPVPLEEVEPVESIVRRFKAGAMSYGSISKEAHETIAVAMNRLGGKSNTGEGGEDPARYLPDSNGDSRSSAIKQVASGRFGVTSEYLVNAREIQIKMAQGAKPGEGGQLPGHKVYPDIAKVRHSTPGVGLISPPPHHDIYSIEDLAQLIHDLKNANDEALINVKLVAEVGVGTIAAGVAKARADVILISGFDGGTGASPLTSIKHAGLPWELGLSETQQTLVLNNLRSRVRLEVDGQLKTGRDVVVGALLGAEEFGFGTLPLVALGCVMMRVCHLNTCPVGVATQDPRLRAKFVGRPEHVENLMRFIAEEVRELMAELGFRSVDEMVGRSDCLEVHRSDDHWKARHLNLDSVLYRPKVPGYVGTRCQTEQDHGLEDTLDVTHLLSLCKPALERGFPVSVSLPIRNTDRVVGTILGSEITRRYGSAGLPDGTINLYFRGSAGQSFGAFIPPGVTLTLEGDANDYVGKGLSGGRIVVFPPRKAGFPPEENVIVGNVAFYGATRGEAFVCGIAGERFCVRNSGMNAVAEGVGDHACEYMTGGRVVVLGRTGRNFAAGMSGGIAYVLDSDASFPRRCNLEMVGLFPLEKENEVTLVKQLVQKHFDLTGSPLAWNILNRWDEAVRRFVKVYPNDYRRVIEAQERLRQKGRPEEEVLMSAFQENATDHMRVGGN